MRLSAERVGEISFDILFYDTRRPGPGVKGPQGRLATLRKLHAASPSAALQERIDRQDLLLTRLVRDRQ